MPLFKCQHCEHMFTDKYIHIKCPECGREALRDANETEYSLFFTPKITALRDDYELGTLGFARIIVIDP